MKMSGTIKKFDYHEEDYSNNNIRFDSNGRFRPDQRRRDHEVQTEFALFGIGQSH